MDAAPLQPVSTTRQPTRDSRVRRVIAEWRRLTGGTRVRDAERSTLVACSGGADSSALAIALATAPARVALAHVLHDMRPPDEAIADRNAVRALADRLGLDFLESSVGVRSRSGNTERIARDLRYEALDALCAEAGCAYVATAHHADDQLETVLMRILRGAGPVGLAGIAPSRPLSRSTLVRPMLVIEREECEGICLANGWVWREDLTNLDTTRTRAAIRHNVIPELKAIRPDAARRAAVSADTCRDASSSLGAVARRLDRAARIRPSSGSLTWRRDMLRRAPAGLVAQLLRSAYPRVVGGAGRDKLTSAVTDRAVRAVRDESGAERCLDLGLARVVITREDVRLEAKRA